MGMGGAETQLCSLADEFYSRGNKVTIVFLNGEQVVFPKNKNIEIINLCMKKNIFSFAEAILNFRKIINDINPDVIHSHMIHSNIFCRISRLFIRMPLLVCSSHNSNEGNVFRMLAYRLTNNLSEINTNVGKESVDSFVRMGAIKKGKMLVAYNGIDTDKFTYSTRFSSEFRKNFSMLENDKLLISIGRNDPAKDYDNLFKAISLIPKKYKFKLLVVGLNVEQLSTHECFDYINDRVVLLGLRKDVPYLLSAADILVMSSAWEGLPIVIGEAMSSECIIVTTDAGGCKEWLNENNWVVPVKNSEALSEAIIKCLELDKRELRVLSKQNRNHIEYYFSIKTITSWWEKLYNEYIARSN